MIWISIFLYICILWIAFMDYDYSLNYVMRIIEKRLKPFGISVDVTLHDNKTVTLTATKKIGINTQYATIHSDSSIEAVWILVKHIEQNFAQWIEKELY